LPSQIVSIYLANTRSAQALAKQYGFDFLSYWQPSLFQKLSLTQWERKQAESEIPAVRVCVEATSRLMSGLVQQYGVIDVSGLFRDQTRPYFVDEVHLSDDGNRMVAERMMRDIMPLIAALSARTEAHPSASPRFDQSSNRRVESTGRHSVSVRDPNRIGELRKGAPLSPQKSPAYVLVGFGFLFPSWRPRPGPLP
jgi:hypothetical protein